MQMAKVLRGRGPRRMTAGDRCAQSICGRRFGGTGKALRAEEWACNGSTTSSSRAEWRGSRRGQEDAGSSAESVSMQTRHYVGRGLVYMVMELGIGGTAQEYLIPIALELHAFLPMDTPSIFLPHGSADECLNQHPRPYGRGRGRSSCVDKVGNGVLGYQSGLSAR
jgi:hypothetical protein